MKKTFKVFRYDPSQDKESRYDEFPVTTQPTDRILDCLNTIRWEQDTSLAFRLSCAHGVCGSCAVMMNGKVGLACQALVKDYEEEMITVDPIPSFTVLRDLIVDIEPFLKKVEQIKPYLISHTPAPEQERLQDPADQNKIDQVIRCILCASCTAACPVTAENPEYIGPAVMVQAFRRIFDTRDDETRERLQQMDDENAAWACVNHFECTKVCPKEILITKSINIMKREIEKELR